ncbi:MAG: tyrosine-type recombinase/integrase [Gammaproteobacteria bacterium]
MAQRKPPGLIKVGNTWHIDKHIKGYGRYCESCATDDLDEALSLLICRSGEIKKSVVQGIRPKKTFDQAAEKYLSEYKEKRSIGCDALDVRTVSPFIGDLPLEHIHDGTLERFKQKRLETVAPATVNRTLAIVRRILILAARKWRHKGTNLSWLETAPMIEMVPDLSPREPYPLSWKEQRSLFEELPRHLALMAIFKVNTGLREREVTLLSWDWEYKVPELDSSIFIIPRQFVKNKADRLVVLNSVARSVIGECRGKHPDRVFTYKGTPVARMNNSAWHKARDRAGLPQVRVHDLKHTYGRRLRAAGVSFEDRQDLLGHKSRRITTHYSAPEIGNLIQVSELVTHDNSRRTPELTLVKVRGTA